MEVLLEEEIFPMLIHQKLSVTLAQEIFAISDTFVLSAIGCHTTLRKNATPLDKVVFVADKIEWDQPGYPPYLDDVLAALEKSLNHAAFSYLNYLWSIQDELKVLHPWAREAYLDLREILQL